MKEMTYQLPASFLTYSPAASRRLAFSYDDGGDSSNYASVDNVALFTIDDFPTCVTMVTPSNGATGVSITGLLEWAANDQTVKGFYINFGTDGAGVTSPSSILSNKLVTTNTYNFNEEFDYYLNTSTVYYIQIKPFNLKGNTTGCSIFSFTTENTQVLLFEQFEDSFPPNGWTMDSPDSFADWFQYSYYSYPSYFAEVDDLSSDDISRLITPEITPTLEYSGLELSFSYGHITRTGNDKFFVEVTYDNGVTYFPTSIISLPETEYYPPFVKVQVDISSVLAPNLPFRLSFTYDDGPSNNEYYSTLDNVLIKSYHGGNVTICPSLVFPNKISESDIVTVAWSGTQYAHGYRVFLGNDGNGLVDPSNIFSDYDLGGLNSFQFNGTRGVTYYIKIVPYNPSSNLTDCPIMSFEVMSYNEYASLYTTFEGPALTSPILGTNTLYLTPLPLIFNELLPYAFHIAKVTQQYPIHAEGSTEYSIFRAKYATGRPDVNVCKVDVSYYTWAPYSSYISSIDLYFEESVYASKLIIYLTYSTINVLKVELLDEVNDIWVEVFSGEQQVLCNSKAQIDFPRTSFTTKAARVLMYCGEQDYEMDSFLLWGVKDNSNDIVAMATPYDATTWSADFLLTEYSTYEVTVKIGDFTVTEGSKEISLINVLPCPPITFAINPLYQQSVGKVMDHIGTDNYKSNTKCIWTLSPRYPITINFTKFQLEGPNDNLEIKYSNGQQINTVTIVSGITLPQTLAIVNATLTFTSDSTITDQGFELDLFPSYCNTTGITTFYDNGRIYSNLGTTYRSNSVCRWQFNLSSYGNGPSKGLEFTWLNDVRNSNLFGYLETLDFFDGNNELNPIFQLNYDNTWGYYTLPSFYLPTTTVLAKYQNRNYDLDGFYFDVKVVDICPEDCHGNGECISNVCWCYPGYSGYQCNETLIEGTCNQFNLLYGRIGELSVNLNQSLYKNPVNCHYLIQAPDFVTELTAYINYDSNPYIYVYDHIGPYGSGDYYAFDVDHLPFIWKNSSLYFVYDNIYAKNFTFSWFASGLSNECNYTEPRDYYVDSINGNDVNNGDSLDSPKRTLQNAYATACDGDILNLAPGNYTKTFIQEKSVNIVGLEGPNVTFIADQSDFTLKVTNNYEYHISNVTIVGGFTSNPLDNSTMILSLTNVRLLDANMKILLGKNDNATLFIDNLEAYNSIISVNSFNGDIQIKNSKFKYVQMTIVNDKGPLNFQNNEFDISSVVITNINATIVDSRFSNSINTKPLFLRWNALSRDHFAIISNVTFENNRLTAFTDQNELPASLGIIDYSRNVSSEILISNCKFTNNSNTETTIKLYTNTAIYNKTVVIDNCYFYNNTGSIGGGISGAFDHLEINNCWFQDNTAIGAGGAIYTTPINDKIRNCTFIGNNAGEFGGAIHFVERNTHNSLIDNCTFISNNSPQGGSITLTSDKLTKNVTGAVTTIKNSIIEKSYTYLVNSNSTQCCSTHFPAYCWKGGINVNCFPMFTTCFNPNGWWTVDVCTKNATAKCGLVCNSSPYGDQGGAIYVKDFNKLVVTGTTIRYGKSYHGAAIYAQTANVEINDNLIHHNNATYGGALYLMNSTIVTSNSTYQANRALQGGAVFSVTNNTLIDNCTFDLNIAGKFGPVVYAYGANFTVTVSRSTLKNNNAWMSDTVGGAIYCSLDTHCVISKSKLIGNSAYRGGAIGAVIAVNADTWSESYNSLLLQRYGTLPLNRGIGEVTIKSSEFINNTANVGGGFFCGPSCYSLIQNSSFVNNQALYTGGAIHMIEATIQLETSNFNMNAAGAGGALYLDGLFSTFHSYNNSFNFNNALYGGYGGAVNVYLLTGNTDFDGDTFNSNNAPSGGGIVVTRESSVTMKSVTFKYNTADIGSAVRVDTKASITLNNCTFLRNGKKGSDGVILADGFSTVKMFGSVFSGNVAARGGNYYSIYQSQGTISYCTFENTLASSGGLYLGSESNTTIDHSIFFNNTADEGAAISVTGNSLLRITTSEFDSNNALMGAAVYSTLDSRVIIESCYVMNSMTEHGAVYCNSETPNSITITGTTFSFNNATISGSALHVTSNCEAIISDSLFYNDTSIRGTVYIESPYYQLSNSDFERNQPEQGVLYFADFVLENSIGRLTNLNFEENYVPEGSIIFMENFRISPDTPIINKRDHLRKAYYRIAMEEDVGLLYNISQSCTNCNFTGNTAYNSFSSGGRRMVPQQLPAGNLVKNSFPFTVILQFEDSFGQKILHELENVEISAKVSRIPSSPSLLEPELLGTTKVLFEKGFANFTSTILGDLEKSYILSFTSDKYQQLDIVVTVSKCEIGEERVPFILKGYSISICYECPPGKYNLNGNQTCLDCPYGALCKGGSNVVSREGFWLYTNDIGEIQAYTCPQGFCKDGGCTENRQGVLCGSCIQGYYEFNNKCVECKSANGPVLFGLFIALWAYVTFLQVSSYRKPDTEGGASGRVKIILFFFQMSPLIIGPISGISWALNFFNFGITDSGTGETCIAPLNFYGAFITNIGVALGSFLFLPVNLFLHKCLHFVIKISGWVNAKRFEVDINMYYRAIGALLIFSYTTIAKAVFNFLTCTKVATYYILVSNPSVECDASDYHNWSVLAFILMIYVFLAPVILLLLLLRWNKQGKLWDTQFVLRWGIFYDCYLPRAFWWEVVVILRRTLLILFYVVWYNITSLRSYMMLLVITLVLFMHILFKPYAQKHENIFETCLMVILMLLAGLQTSLLSTDPQYNERGAVNGLYIVAICCAILMVFWPILVKLDEKAGSPVSAIIAYLLEVTGEKIGNKDRKDESSVIALEFKDYNIEKTDDELPK